MESIHESVVVFGSRVLIALGNGGTAGAILCMGIGAGGVWCLTRARIATSPPMKVLMAACGIGLLCVAFEGLMCSQIRS